MYTLEVERMKTWLGWILAALKILMGTNEKRLVSGLQQLSNQLPLVTLTTHTDKEITRQTGCNNSGSRASWSAEMTHIPRAVTTFLFKK